MKKMLIALMVGLLGATFAVAEENGGFIGAGVARGNMEFKYESGGLSYNSPSFNSTRIPIIVGTKRFFTQKFGIRFGGIIDMIEATEEGSDGSQWKSGGIDVFVDALFNFLNFEKLDVGAFGGVSLGWGMHSNKAWGRTSWSGSNQYDEGVSGLDVGLNVGVRTNLFSHHGVEVYYHRNFLEQKGEYSDGSTIKFKRPSQIGVRYIYSF